MRRIKGGSGSITGQDRSPGRAPDGSRAIDCWNSALCQKANTAHVLSPRPFARRHLAANFYVVDRSGPDPATRSPVALWEQVCVCASILAKNVGNSVGRSRRLAPIGFTLFEGSIPERGRKTLVPAPASRNPELLAGAPSPGAGWPMALCTHPPLQCERSRCDPATSVKIEVNRSRYRQLLFGALDVDERLASAIACIDRQWRHSCDVAGRHQARR